MFEPGLANVSAEAARRRPRPDGSAKFPMPQIYWDMMQEVDGSGTSTSSNSGAGSPSADATEEDASEQLRSFWRSVRQTARARLGEGAAPDCSKAEQRVAELRESLWVEELTTRLELQKCRFSVDHIPHVRDNLFSVDVSMLDDEVVAPRAGQGLLRGVLVQIRCSMGNTYVGSVQPGSGVGNMLIAASMELENAQGPYAVELKPQRFPQLAMHRALASPAAERLLQAEATVAAVSEAAADDVPPDVLKSLPDALNDGQRRAVISALQPAAQHPLLIWGPPGTGKSTLAAFIIWHLVQQRPTDTQVLVSAPSNTAADLMCSKLGRLGLDATRMLRLNALGRSWATAPEDILEFSSYELGPDGRNTFVVPPLKKLREFKVIVTTCICASHISGSLRAAKAAPDGGWFSHVVVDEAGEATEPETLVALSLLRPVAGRAVVLGDHFQLGPLVTSPIAKQLSGLDASMLERLAKGRFAAAADAGTDAGDDEASVRKGLLRVCEDRGLFFLTESYRSHPDIMAIYSSLFYSDQLDHSPRPAQMALMPFFKAKGLSGPVLLHNTVGTERREPGSSSVYNSEEVRQVALYLHEVLEDRTLGLSGEDVGVITPYTRQVAAIERHLASLGPRYAAVDVGTVERFQGQERKLIILSTVRSSERDDTAPASALRRPIGFVADWKRMNVAVSRAVAGLVLVGDLRTLSLHSSHWRAMIEMGKESGALLGQPLLDLQHRRSTAADRGQHAGAAVPPPQSVPAAEATSAWDTLTSA